MTFLLRFFRALKQSGRNLGFSLLEQIIILVIVGILSAIAAPGWNGFLQARELNVAQEQVQAGIKQAQHLAKMQRIPYNFVIHDNTGLVEWGISPENRSPIEWKSAGPLIRLDDQQTTFRKNTRLNQWFLVLDDDGSLSGQLGRVTLCVKSSQNASHCTSRQKCVIMSTLLGETRRGEWHDRKRDNKFNCY